MEKQCSKCKKILPVDNFFKVNKKGEKLRSECKKCCYKDSRKWEVKNSEKRQEIGKRWVKKVEKKYGLGITTLRRYGFKLALKVYENYNRKCAECGEEHDLTIHHKDQKGRNYENIGLKPNNSEENLVVLCRSCHGRLHSKKYWKEQKRKEKHT